MIKLTLLASLLASCLMVIAADSANAPVYEMRVYYAPEGKLDDLHARFRDHTARLFEKHGIENVAYFVPEGANPENKLVYFLSYPSREAREKSWKAFFADPEWQKAARESEKDGPIVIGRRIESIFLTPTDYSPTLKIEKKGNRIVELRTYTTPEGKLDDLHARFRDHTMELFKKHGMDNLIYWTKMPGQKDADTTLIYLLAHDSRDARNKSFDSFRKDPDWIKAKTESEKNGSLTVPNGVKSEILVPTDYSPFK